MSTRPAHSLNYGNGLTKSQASALGIILRYTAEHGWAPTIQELAPLLQLRTAHAVWRVLCELEGHGVIRRGRGARQIKVLQYARCPYCHGAKRRRVK